MSVATEIQRIQSAKADIKASIEAKGVQVPASALIDDYSGYVDQISGGGGQAEQDLIDLIERDITSITIPSGVTSIGSSAFQSCSNLTSVTIPNTVTAIGNTAFYGCTGLTSVTIPSTVTSIGTYAFQNCSSLTSVTIPNGVTTIGTYTFYGCTSLTSVTIPSGVTTIGNNAFYGCTRLTSITVEATTPPTLGGTATFNNTNDCPIYVPAASVETYKTTNKWSSYSSRIQAIPTT